MKFKLIYRHMCLDQNLQSIFLNSQQQGQPRQINPNNQVNVNNPNVINQLNGIGNQLYANPNLPNLNGQQSLMASQSNQNLICRNALGQDLTLSKDLCKAVIKILLKTIIFQKV